LNTWDTSNSYSNGVSEEIIGKAIRKYNIPRHKLISLAKSFNPSRESNAEELLKLSREDLKKFNRMTSINLGSLGRGFLIL
jgi:aryl-alcohol dehydrogenase-like predicted oxidoreductase